MTVIADNAAGSLMRQKKIDLVITGADRIAQNGDVANKIGTYGLAVLSKYHHIPFYVVAPTTTIDISLASGMEIPIEERNHQEVTHFQGRPITPREIEAFNPAFDVTPHSLIQGIITEKGVIQKPFKRELQNLIEDR